jgi:hypothetical protein
VTITADEHVILRNSFIDAALLEAATVDGGSVEINTPLLIVDRSGVSVSTGGAASAVGLRINAAGGDVILTGKAPESGLGGIFSLSVGGEGNGAAGLNAADAATAGNGAPVSIITGRLLINNLAAISATTNTSGRGGNVDIAADTFVLDGSGSELLLEKVSSINAQTEQEAPGGGRGGDIRIRGGTFEVRNFGVITSSTLGSGDAGSVSVSGDRVSVTGNSIIGSAAQEGEVTGRAGGVTIEAARHFELRDNAVLSVAGEDVAGGNISVRSGGDLFVLDRANVTAESGGDGGNIGLFARRTLAIGDSIVTAEAAASGSGAQITLAGDGIAALGNSTVNGLTTDGLDVPVTISNPTVLLAGSTQILSDRTTIPFSQSEVTLIDVLPAIALGRGPQLQASCADLAAGAVSTFLVRGREGVDGGYRLGTE